MLQKHYGAKLINNFTFAILEIYEDEVKLTRSY